MASIFDIFAAELEGNPGHLQDFLSQGISEGLSLEYKESAGTERLLQSIAGMANTHGGMILLGVKAAGDRPGETVGVDPASREALVNQCHAKLDPPMHPEIVPVTVDGKTVLVVRIDLTNLIRPVVLDGKVWVRAADGMRQPISSGCGPCFRSRRCRRPPSVRTC